jgi:hypothetical protein
MTAVVSIVINQVGLPPGQPGVSRSDVVAGTYVQLTNGNNTSIIYWQWSFVSWPQLTPTEPAPTMYDSLTKQAYFMPEHSGTYIVKLIVNRRVEGTLGLTVRTANMGMYLPAEGQTTEFAGTFDYYVLNALHIIDSYGGSAPPIGSASGDLSGTYPGPTVARIQGRRISPDVPTDGYALAWSDTQNMWVPGNVVATAYDYASAPTNPEVGSRWIVQPTGTGDFAGHDNEIGTWNGSVWAFKVPSNHQLEWVQLQDCWYYYSGSVWVKIVRLSVAEKEILDATTKIALQTLNDTPTVAASITLTDNALYVIEAVISAKAGTVEAAYAVLGKYSRTGGGGATLLGTVEDVMTPYESEAGLNGTLIINGNNVEVQVTGKVATSINWTITLWFQRVA